MSLKLRLMGAIALVLLATLLAAGLLIYWHANTKIALEMRSALSVGKKAASALLLDFPLATNPSLTLIRLVKTFDGNRHLKVSFVNAEGKRAVTSSPQTPDDDVPAWFAALFSAHKLTGRIELPENLGRIGALVIEADPANEIDEVWRDLILKLTIFAVFCALVLGLIYAVLAFSLRPLDTMTAAFERIGGADYAARLPVEGPTELAKLATGFNDMAGRLDEMEQRNAKLNVQLANLQEEERADLARDLHDEVSPFLFSVDVDARAIAEMAEGSQRSDIAERASSVREAAAHMKQHVKSILTRLRPATGLDLGLVDALESLVASWQGRHPDLDFHLDVTGPGWGERIDQVIFIVVREGIANALQHAKPTRVEIRVTRREDGAALVRVIDDGGGLRERSQPTRSFGIVGMRERVAALGGELKVTNRADGRGAVLDAVIPAPDNEKKTEPANAVGAA